MAFCDHCDGQRYDRAQILRTLRAMRLKMRDSDASGEAERVVALAIETVRSLQIPHFDVVDDDVVDVEVIH